MNDIKFSYDDKFEKCFVPVSADIKRYSLTDILEILKNVGVNTGIKEEVIKELLLGKFDLENTVCIAEALLPTRGQDGRFEYLIDDSHHVKKDDSGKANFYDVGLIKSVKFEQKLVEIIPPTSGKPGKTVFGKIIPGIPGAEIDYNRISGPGTKQSPDKVYLIAGIDGIYNRNPVGKISVFDTLTIDEDLNFEVGNINTSSSVTIKQDIKSGFECISESNIDVGGVIEDAFVKAGDSIICRKGILNGEKEIIAKNTIRAKYIRSREYVESKDIFIEEMVSQSNINCHDRMEAKKITGGNLIIYNSLQVEELGSEQFSETEIRIGINPKMLDSIEKMRQEQSKYTEDLNHLIKENDDDSIELKKIRKRLDAVLEGSNEVLAKKLTEEYNSKNKQVTINFSKIEVLKKNIELSKKRMETISKKMEAQNPYIIVKKHLYPNVSIRFKQGIVHNIKEVINHPVKIIMDERNSGIKIINL